MALLFIDGFDHYASADALKKWTSGSCSINTTSGRRGGGCLIVSNGASQYLIKNIGSSKSTLIFGAACKYDNTAGSDLDIIRLRDSSTTQIGLALDPLNRLKVFRGGVGGTLLGTSSLSLQNGFNYIEFKVVFSNTGSYELRVNGTTWLTGTSVDTTSSANNNADNLLLGTSSGNWLVQYYDDLYLCDDTGATNNNFLGDCRIDSLMPNADGTYQQWSPTPGGTHYTTVDETAPNSTDYVESSTIGNRDTYGFQDMTTNGVIYGVQTSIAALKNDAGSRSIKSVVKSSATVANGATQALNTTQNYYSDVFATDPNTSTAWTQSGVNNAEFGVEAA